MRGFPALQKITEKHMMHQKREVVVEILRNVTWFYQHKRAPVHMRGATSGKIIVPMVKDWLQVQAGNVRNGYIDVLCYYYFHTE